MKINALQIKNLLIAFSQKTKFLFWGIFVHFAFMIGYDLLTSDCSAKEFAYKYLTLIFICLFVWFGVKLVFGVQIKNSFCGDGFFNLFSILALIVFGIGSVLVAIEYYVNGYVFGAFVGPIAWFSVLHVQKLRK